MNKFLLLCCVVVAAMFLIISCKDNEPEGPVSFEGPYFNSKEGSMWIYSNYLLQDAGGTVEVQKLEKDDTLIQGANSIVLGRDAIMMQHLFLNPLVQFATTADYAIYEDKSANKGYVNSDFMKIFLPEFLQIALDIAFSDDKWYMLADGNATKEWILDSFAMTNVSLGSIFPGNDVVANLGITLDGHLKFGVKKGSDTTILSIKANTYTLSIFFEGAAVSSNPVLQLLLSTFGNVRVDMMQTNFYLSSKGLLGIYSPVTSMAIYSIANPNQSQSLPITSDGFDKQLLHIDVK